MRRHSLIARHLPDVLTYFGDREARQALEVALALDPAASRARVNLLLLDERMALASRP